MMWKPCAMVRAQAKETVRLQAEVARLETLVSGWEHLADQLRRMHMGRRSEKLDPEQFALALEDLETPLAEVEAEQDEADPSLKADRARERRQSPPLASRPPARGRGGGRAGIPAVRARCTGSARTCRAGWTS